MNTSTFTIYSKIDELPKNWDDVAIDNAFLKKAYLAVLASSAPTNMQCFYIGIYEDSQLIGVALAQYLDLNQLESFGERDNTIKRTIRNFVFKNFASHVLFLGNNMITGQNGYTFKKAIPFKHISELLMQCAEALTTYFKNKEIDIHLVSFKDFYPYCADELKRYAFGRIYEFNTQPNMTLEIREEWKFATDYVTAFSKKYRDQYKRARKKCEAITIREMPLQEIVSQENRIYELYRNVAQNAPFNTFFLTKNHFSEFKKQLKDQFVLVGYFLNGTLVGFHTLLLNGRVLETYFLGYDKKVQKEKLLYLNMLYNMTEYGLEQGFKKIIFGRTALEIKSSIGAQPVAMSGFIYHRNKLINHYIGAIFKQLEPETIWQQRHPFQ